MKKVLTTAVTAITMAGLVSAPAFAWTYSMQGTGACQPDGSFEITWTVNNTSEDQPLHITDSSNEAVVAKGTDVPAHKSKEYMQTVDGKKTGQYKLSLSGNWDGDKTVQQHSATVNQDTACEQPGGKGGDTPTPPTTTTTTTTPTSTTTAAPAVTPVGAVNAGGGGASSAISLPAIGALVASAGAVLLGVVRRVRHN